MIKREQNLYSNTENFEISIQQLNLKMNQESIFECHSHMLGDYPVFIPHKSLLEEKLVEEAHFHGGGGWGAGGEG